MQLEVAMTFVAVLPFWQLVDCVAASSDCSTYLNVHKQNKHTYVAMLLSWLLQHTEDGVSTV